MLRPARTTFSLAASAGYGLREPLPAGAAAHHTALGALGAALSGPLGLAGELRVDGRLEVPSAGAEQSPALVGALRGYLRYSHAVGERLDLGLEMGVWVPGGAAPSLRFDATTLDMLAAFDARVGGPVSLVGAVGFRFDQSAKALSNPDRLSRSDWLVLGLSDSHAALARLGAELALGRTRTFVEWTWDILLGDDAPALLASPMQLGLGTRVDLDRRGRFSWLVAARALVSKRPPIDVAGPLVPFPPRGELWSGLELKLGDSPQPTAPARDARARAADAGSQPSATDEPASLPSGAAQLATSPGVELRIVGKDKQTIAGATVQLQGRDALVSDASGRLLVADLPPGEHTLTISAEGFAPQTVTTRLAAGESPRIEVVLSQHQPSGQLRFLVRDHETGEPLAANIQVKRADGGAAEQDHKANDQGRFELDLPPGRYQVEVKLYGWRKQKKTVEIEDESVTLIDAALHPRSKKRR
jgi:hypothetical protein